MCGDASEGQVCFKSCKVLGHSGGLSMVVLSRPTGGMKVSYLSKQRGLNHVLAENVPSNTLVMVLPSYAWCHAGLRYFKCRVHEAHVRELVYASEESDA